ncbi:MAG: RHS repeat-associated core domain-containing protein, partial [Candidatus Aenigmatarchaeota archaeon]
FGEKWVTAGWDPGLNDYKYTGKELDDATGLYYYGARYYKPEVGRFTQADALRGNLEDPLSLHRYVYTRNNPLKYVDPTGNSVMRLPQIELPRKQVITETTHTYTDKEGNVRESTGKEVNWMAAAYNVFMFVAEGTINNPIPEPAMIRGGGSEKGVIHFLDEAVKKIKNSNKITVATKDLAEKLLEKLGIKIKRGKIKTPGTSGEQTITYGKGEALDHTEMQMVRNPETGDLEWISKRHDNVGNAEHKYIPHFNALTEEGEKITIFVDNPGG